MYRRIRRTEEDSFPDIIRRAVRNIGVPMVREPSDEHRQMAYLTGHQLSPRLRSELDFRLDKGRPEAAELMRELGRCSEMIVVSTLSELVLVSDHSPDEFRTLKERYAGIVHRDDQLSEEWSKLTTCLSELPKPQQACRRGA
jgi:hypothetical protein